MPTALIRDSHHPETVLIVEIQPCYQDSCILVGIALTDLEVCTISVASIVGDLVLWWLCSTRPLYDHSTAVHSCDLDLYTLLAYSEECRTHAAYTVD